MFACFLQPLQEVREEVKFFDNSFVRVGKQGRIYGSFGKVFYTLVTLAGLKQQSVENVSCGGINVPLAAHVPKNGSGIKPEVKSLRKEHTHSQYTHTQKKYIYIYIYIYIHTLIHMYMYFMYVHKHHNNTDRH